MPLHPVNLVHRTPFVVLAFLAVQGVALGQGAKPGAEKWQVQVDPAPRAVRLAGNQAPAVPAHGPNGTALFPTTPSPFVLVGALELDGSYVHRVWNVETGTAAGPVKIKNDICSFSRLSPDGKWLVGRDLEQGSWSVSVWDAHTGQRVWRDPTLTGLVPYSDFVGKDRIVEVSAKYLKVWSFRDGKLVHDMKPKAGIAVSGGFPSPGRRYLARFEQEGMVRVYDMEVGKLAGETSLSLPPNARLTAAAMVFSSDGRELAAFYRVGRDSEWSFALWDVANGKLAANHTVPRETMARLDALATLQSPPAGFGISIVPERRGLLIRGVGLFEPQSGRLVWTVPTPPGIRRYGTPTVWVGADRFLAYLGPGGGSEPLAHLVTLPADLDKRLTGARTAGVKPRPVPMVKPIDHVPPANPDAAKELAQLEADLQSGDFGRATRALRALGKRKDADAAALLVKHYERHTTLAKSGLEGMGGTAAPLLVRLLESPNFAVRLDGLDLLARFGTAKELPAVEKASSDSNPLVQRKAKQAAATLKRRVK